MFRHLCGQTVYSSTVKADAHAHAIAPFSTVNFEFADFLCLFRPY